MARLNQQLARRLVFEALLHRGPISRADLAQVTPFSKQTISEIIDIFEGQGWVRPIGRTRGNVGRKAVLYELNKESVFVAGVDLGGTKITAALADLSGAIVAERTENTDTSDGQAMLAQLVRMVKALEADAGCGSGSTRIAVVGTPGFVNTETGGLDMAPNIPGGQLMNVADRLKAELGATPILENDVNLAVLGERWHGCAQSANNVAFIALGTGIGLGLAIDGRLVRGARGAAGEIALLPLGEDPYTDEARSTGALELSVAAAGIMRAYRRHGGGEIASAKDVFDRLEQDQAARAAIADTSRLMALGIASVAALFDPELVVLGGSIGTRAEFIDCVRREVSRCVARPPNIQASKLGNRAGVVGAVAVALNRLYDDLFGLADLPDELSLPVVATPFPEAASKPHANRSMLSEKKE